MTAPTIYATPERVAVAWLAALPGLNASMVGTTLPSDESLWSASGYITAAVTGGSPDTYYRVGRPVVTLNCWGVTSNTGLPPWNKAQNLAEIVRMGTYLNSWPWLSMPNCDERARVMTAYLAGEPRRHYGDLGDYAAYVVDLALDWATTA